MIAPLTTARLTLRLPLESDLEAMIGFGTSPRSALVGGTPDRFQNWRGLLANIGHWTLRGHGYWSVDRRDAGTMIGRVGVIFHDGWQEPELAWHLFDGAEGQGFAFEAATAARDDYHARLTAAPLISYIHPDNARSQALARRLGARPERDLLFGDDPATIWRHPAPGGAG